MFTKLKKRIEEENQTELNIGIPLTPSPPSPTPTHSRRASESSTDTPVRSTCSDAPDSDRELKVKGMPSRSMSPSGNDHFGNAGTRGGTPRKSAKGPEYQEMCHKLQLIQREKQELERRLAESERNVALLAGRCDSREELESFQSQEMAKVKHLLLCSQQELRAADEKLRQRSEECHLAQERASQLEKALAQGDQGQSKALTRDKLSLEAQVDRLKEEALQNAGRVSQLECTLGNLTDQHDGLKHTHDLYKSKTTTLLEEKDSLISDLRDKVQTLEKRLQDSGLTGEEQVLSLVEERKALEKKLDESRQHLFEVKSSWSEKINNLEAQILNLNQKMAEDAQEGSRMERELEHALRKLKLKEQECWKLEEDVQRGTSELVALKESKDEELVRQRSLQDAQLDQLRLQVAGLRSDLSQLQKERDRESHQAQSRIAELAKKEVECQKSLDRIQELESSSRVAADKISKLESEASLLVHSEQTLKQAAKQYQEERKLLMEELDSLKLRNASLSGENERLKQECSECQQQGKEEQQQLKCQVETLEASLRETTSKLQALETETSQSVDNCSSLGELRAKVAQLEEQLSEKNKALKLLQQRMSDMKKTLQRELRCQQNSGNNSEGVQTTSEAKSEEEQTSGALVGDGVANRGLQGTGRPSYRCLQGKLEDDINFKYLKHVVFKFMTSKEYEAQHLIRAVSVLLRFTADEEQLIREHLDWKNSWFGSRPHPHALHPHHPPQHHHQRSSLAPSGHSKGGTRPS